MHVERCHGGLYLYPNFFLLSIRCYSWAKDLDMHVLGEFAMGLVVFGVAACIRLI